MVVYKQENRLLSVDTPLGKDVLLLAGFSGTEALSQLFSYRLEMFSTEENIKARDIVGKNVTWSVDMPDMDPRYFNGFVSRFSAGGRSIQGLRVYIAEVVPWLWFLTRTSNCRIFQGETVQQIVEKIYRELGFTDFKS